MRSRIIFSLCLACSLSVQAQQPDTITIHFERNTALLSDKAKLDIEKAIKRNPLKAGDDIQLLGYADFLGSKEHNDSLSVMRAENTKTFMVAKGIPAGDFIVCKGEGQVNRTNVGAPDGYPADRKVLVIFNRKKMESVQKTKIDINSLKINQTAVLKNLHFSPATHFLLKESEPELENIYQLMANNPTLKVRIEGHICCQIANEISEAIDEDNSGPLSETRARAIYQFLIDKGIKKDRLSYVGLGFTHPLFFPEQNEGQQSQNRRVEIRILEK